MLPGEALRMYYTVKPVVGEKRPSTTMMMEAEDKVEDQRSRSNAKHYERQRIDGLIKVENEADIKHTFTT